jgi:hypothetical protein
MVVVGHAALAFLTALSWLGLGAVVLAPFPSTGDRLLDVANRVGAGAIGFALLTMASGWLGLLDRTAYRVVFVATVVTGVVAAVNSLQAPLPRRPRLAIWELALVVLLALYVLLGVIAVSAPVTSPDALLYHASDPALFVEAGRVFEIPWNSSSYEPFTVEMLVVDGALLWDVVQGAFAPFLLALLTLAVVIAGTARLAGRQAALIAGAVFFAQPFILWESTSVFVEPALAATIALASWNAVRFVQSSSIVALALAGVFAGAGAGAKYLGLIAACALAVGLLVACGRRLEGRHVLAFSLPAVLVAAPWYIKNAILTGNPFYPHLFGGLNAAAEAELERSMQSFGNGQGVLDLLLMPARFLTDGDSYDGGEWISPLFVAFAPLIALAPASRRYAVPACAAIAVFVLAWFLTTQQARFLLPVMPVAAVLAALGLLALVGRGAVGRAVAVGATTAALGVGLAASLLYTSQFVPVVAGTERKRDFLAHKVSLYNGVEWLNRHLDARDRVAVDFWSLLYLRMPYTTFGTMGDLLPRDAGRADTRAFVQQYDITYMAFLAGDAKRTRQARSIGARLVASVPVRSVRSRTRGDLGPRRLLAVYALERSP